MVALSVEFVAVVSNGEQVLVGSALVALIVAAKEFAEVGVESQFAAADNLVGILDGFFQTCVGLSEGRVGLCACNGCHLGLRERIVAPNQVGACQQSLCRLFRRNARVAVVVEQQCFGVSQIFHNLIENHVEWLTVGG